jgi:O-antigen ligase
MKMRAPIQSRTFHFSLTFAVLVGFYFFYLKYVPLVQPFQLVLIPILVSGFLLTAVKPEWGVLFFVFFFPLINNLPYLFGIFEDTPHAPTALVLFLAFFLGWMARGGVADSRMALNYPLIRPLTFFLGIVSVSGIITFLRYSNFFPFRTDEIYELIVNINGVRAGGALMSDVFTFLNYLTGPFFFLMVLPLLTAPKFMKKVLFTLSLATLLALAFSLLQKYYSLSLGNTPLSIRFNQINSTFKDANSFGAFLSCFIPLALGMALSFPKSFRWTSLFLVVFSIFIFPAIGSRSSLAALTASLITFGILVLMALRISLKKKLFLFASILLAVAVLIALLFVFQGQSTLAKRVGSGWGLLSKNISLDEFFNRRLYFWRAAEAMFEAYPLTGVGLGAYIIELPNYFQHMGYSFRRTDSALNYFFQVAAELGLIGLLAITWVTIEIFRQLLRTWKTCPPGKKFLLAGVLAGLAAFGVNFCFQTFVGSYEVKSTFWLLLALAFSIDGAREFPVRTRGQRRNFTALGLLLILTFGAVYLSNSTGSLSLETRTKDLHLSQDFGLDRVEKTADGLEFRWSQKSAGLAVRIEKSTLGIPLLASHPDIQKNPVKVRLFLVKNFFREKKLLDVITIREELWKTYHYSLAEDQGQEVILLFKVSRTWNPLKTLGIPDSRNLGVAIGKIEF